MTESVRTDDGWRLHVERSGAGAPVVFLHEFGGDHRSWAPQVHRMDQQRLCVTYAARGYPPSDVPPAVASYSQERAVGDLLAVLDGLGLPSAHLVGLSMGGFAALHAAMRCPERCSSVVAAGVGYGSYPGEQDGFRAEAEATAAAFLNDPVAAAERYAAGPTRVQLRRRDPAAHAEFRARLAAHSAIGSANTMRGVQGRRPSLYELRGQLERITAPTLLIVGDEDDGCLETNLMLKRCVPTAGLAVLPNTGHTCNLEDPDAFTALVEGFLDAVEDGRWPMRDPDSRGRGLVGMAHRS